MRIALLALIVLCSCKVTRLPSLHVEHLGPFTRISDTTALGPTGHLWKKQANGKYYEPVKPPQQ